MDKILKLLNEKRKQELINKAREHKEEIKTHKAAQEVLEKQIEDCVVREPKAPSVAYTIGVDHSNPEDILIPYSLGHKGSTSICAEVGLLYPTEEAAQLAITSMKILTDIQKLADFFNGERLRGYDFEDCMVYLIIASKMEGYFYHDLKVQASSKRHVVSLNPYFVREEDAAEAISLLTQVYREEDIVTALSGEWRV